MAITMQGNWTIKVKSKNAAYKQRFVIKGSENGVDGTYEEDKNPPPVNVNGAQWSVSVEHKPSGSAPWTPSAERLTVPTRSGGQIVFDILSNDTGSDKDYNDLILTCSMTESSSDYVIYGRVRTYYPDSCIANPCIFRPFVIDSEAQLKKILNYKSIRAILENLYPERIREFTKKPLIIKKPLPEPDPIPFRPMMIPMGISGGEFSHIRDEADKTSLSPTRVTRPELGSKLLSTDTDIKAEFSELTALVKKEYVPMRELAKLKHTFMPFCKLKIQPGLLLRFLEYDRTPEELVGGPYTGDGNRKFLGMAVTDEQGNYIFRFSHTLADIADEFDDIITDGPELVTQLRPDIIVQVVSGAIIDALFESALYSNIPNLKRINLCFPDSEINPGPTACQGGRAIQSIGNIWTLPGVGNTLDAEGRITATNSIGPQITRGAWGGKLEMFACFKDLPQVKYYTIRYKRPDGDWSFVQELYLHPKIADIGPPDYKGTKVGPIDKDLAIDGGPLQNVPTYKNIESDSAWVATHRLRKIRLNSHIYAPNSSPGTVSYKIEGYDKDGNKVPNAEDTIDLFIDNRAIDANIDTVKMGILSLGECMLFDLPTPNEPLTVRFKIDHPGGFLQEYRLSVYRGSNTSVPVIEITAPNSQPLSLVYNEATHGYTFRGTLNAINPDVDKYVEAELQAAAGAWLPEGKNFCAFSFEISGTARVTNGYSLDVWHLLDKELVGISYNPPTS